MATLRGSAQWRKPDFLVDADLPAWARTEIGRAVAAFGDDPRFGLVTFLAGSGRELRKQGVAMGSNAVGTYSLRATADADTEDSGIALRTFVVVNTDRLGNQEDIVGRVRDDVLAHAWPLGRRQNPVGFSRPSLLRYEVMVSTAAALSHLSARHVELDHIGLDEQLRSAIAIELAQRAAQTRLGYSSPDNAVFTSLTERRSGFLTVKPDDGRPRRKSFAGVLGSRLRKLARPAPVEATYADRILALHRYGQWSVETGASALRGGGLAVSELLATHTVASETNSVEVLRGWFNDLGSVNARTRTKLLQGLVGRSDCSDADVNRYVMFGTSSAQLFVSQFLNEQSNRVGPKQVFVDAWHQQFGSPPPPADQLAAELSAGTAQREEVQRLKVALSQAADDYLVEANASLSSERDVAVSANAEAADAALELSDFWTQRNSVPLAARAERERERSVLALRVARRQVTTSLLTDNYLSHDDLPGLIAFDLVGPEKPVGDIPTHIAQRRYDMSTFDLIERQRQLGNESIVVPAQWSLHGAETVVGYNELALRDLIEAHRDVLVAAEWLAAGTPANPREFAWRLLTREAPDSIRHVAAIAFADPRPEYRQPSYATLRRKAALWEQRFGPDVDVENCLRADRRLEVELPSTLGAALGDAARFGVALPGGLAAPDKKAGLELDTNPWKARADDVLESKFKHELASAANPSWRSRKMTVEPGASPAAGALELLGFTVDDAGLARRGSEGEVLTAAVFFDAEGLDVDQKRDLRRQLQSLMNQYRQDRRSKLSHVSLGGVDDLEHFHPTLSVGVTREDISGERAIGIANREFAVFTDFLVVRAAQGPMPRSFIDPRRQPPPLGGGYTPPPSPKGPDKTTPSGPGVAATPERSQEVRHDNVTQLRPRQSKGTPKPEAPKSPEDGVTTANPVGTAPSVERPDSLPSAAPATTPTTQTHAITAADPKSSAITPNDVVERPPVADSKRATTEPRSVKRPLVPDTIENQPAQSPTQATAKPAAEKVEQGPRVVTASVGSEPKPPTPATAVPAVRETAKPANPVVRSASTGDKQLRAGVARPARPVKGAVSPSAGPGGHVEPTTPASAKPSLPARSAGHRARPAGVRRNDAATSVDRKESQSRAPAPSPRPAPISGATKTAPSGKQQPPGEVPTLEGPDAASVMRRKPKFDNGTTDGDRVGSVRGPKPEVPGPETSRRRIGPATPGL